MADEEGAPLTSGVAETPESPAPVVQNDNNEQEDAAGAEPDQTADAEPESVEGAGDEAEPEPVLAAGDAGQGAVEAAGDAEQDTADSSGKATGGAASENASSGIAQGNMVSKDVQRLGEWATIAPQVLDATSASGQALSLSIAVNNVSSDVPIVLLAQSDLPQRIQLPGPSHHWLAPGQSIKLDVVYTSSSTPGDGGDDAVMRPNLGTFGKPDSRTRMQVLRPRIWLRVLPCHGRDAAPEDLPAWWSKAEARRVANEAGVVVREPGTSSVVMADIQVDGSIRRLSDVRKLRGEHSLREITARTGHLASAGSFTDMAQAMALTKNHSVTSLGSQRSLQVTSSTAKLATFKGSFSSLQQLQAKTQALLGGPDSHGDDEDDEGTGTGTASLVSLDGLVQNEAIEPSRRLTEQPSRITMSFTAPASVVLPRVMKRVAAAGAFSFASMERASSSSLTKVASSPYRGLLPAGTADTGLRSVLASTVDLAGLAGLRADHVDDDVSDPLHEDPGIAEFSEPLVGARPAGFSLDAHVKRMNSSLKRVPAFLPRKFDRGDTPPLRLPQMIPLDEQLLAFPYLEKVQRHRFTLIAFVNVRITYVQRRRLGSVISKFPNLEVLILKGLGIKTLDDFVLPRVRIADFTDNMIADVRTCVHMCEHAPQLETFEVRENPVELKRNLRAECVAALPHVYAMNNKVVTLEERMAAIEKYGTRKQRKEIPMTHWDLIVSSRSPLVEMFAWIPDMLQDIELTNVELEQFNVAGLSQLRRLVLANNQLTKLDGAGLHTCCLLHTLDVSNNKIQRAKELRVLAFIDGLLHVKLAGNQLTSHYRSLAIYITRSLPGLNRSPGLQTIDDAPVTSEQTLSALRTHGSLKTDAMHEERWQMALVAAFGHTQLQQIPGLLQRVRNASFTGRSLVRVDVSGLPSLLVLDLSDNNLTSLTGLAELKSLRRLNVWNNKNLSIQSVLDQLKQHTSLEQLALYSPSTGAGSKRASRRNTIVSDARLRERRLRVFDMLLFQNPQLIMLDREMVSVVERVNTLRLQDAYSHDADACEAYRFNLAVTVNVTGMDGRRYGPDDVKPGAGYKPAAVTDLPRMNKIELTSHASSSFASFINLVVLNLADNALTDIGLLDLHVLNRLKVLDVTNNRIDNSIGEIAELFDTMVDLEVVSLRGNPCMRNGKARSKLIGQVKRLQQVTCNLRIIDTEVSIDERVDAWKAENPGQEEASEDLRWRATLHIRTPRDMERATMQALDLSDANLSRIDLSEYPELRNLNLSNNKLRSIADIKGLDVLQHLEVLDLRHNLLNSVDEMGAITLKLPSLLSVGFRDNRCSATDRYVKKLLRMMPQLRQIDCKLHVLDDEEIQVSDIVAAWKAEGGKDAQLEEFRWELTMARRRAALPEEHRAAPWELNVVNCALSVVHFDTLTMLRRVSLASNNLTSKALAASKLSECMGLEALDLRNNALKDGKAIAAMADALPKLRALWIEMNPCMRDNSAPSRLSFLRNLRQLEKLGASLKFLNGEEIVVTERCDVLATKDFSNLERFRLALTLETMEAENDWTSLNLAGRRLRAIQDLAVFDKVTFIDLSRNRLETLQDQSLDTLPLLEYLDLRHNSLSSLDASVRVLEHCAKLKFLFLHRSHTGRATAHVNDYHARVCDRLRGVESLDQLKNPTPLSEKQLAGIKTIQRLTKLRRQINPNNTHDVDLSGHSFKPRLFQHVVEALSYLPLQTLKMNNNPWADVPNYRFILIYYNPDLRVLDDKKITTDEQANADRIVRAMKEGRELSKLKDRTGGTVKGTKLANSNAAGAAGASLASLSSLADGDDDEVMQEQVWAKPTGTLITKGEVLINYFQLMALGVSLVDPAVWPPAWYAFALMALPFTLDVELVLPFTLSVQYQWIKFITMMSIPPVMFAIYHFKLNKSRWVDKYVTNWTDVRRKAIMRLVMLMLVTFVLCFIGNYKSNTQQGGITVSVNTWALFGVISCVYVAVFSVWLSNARLFRRNWDKPHFWFTYLKYKKRLALFVMTILYMPLLRSIFMNFKCDQDTMRLQLYPADRCIEVVEDMQPIHWASVGCGVIYSTGIPMFFAKLIRKGVSEIDGNWHVIDDFKDVAKLKAMKDKTKEHRKEIKTMRRTANRKYAAVVKEYESPATYLYSPYTRSHRFNKIINMIEKLALLAVSVFVVLPSVKVIMGVAVLASNTMLGYTSKPYQDAAENTMDNTSRLANTINITMGMLLVNNWYGGSSGITLVTIALFMANISNTLIMALILGAAPLRTWWARRRHRKEAKKAAKAADDARERRATMKKEALEEAARAAVAAAEASEMDTIKEEVAAAQEEINAFGQGLHGSGGSGTVVSEMKRQLSGGINDDDDDDDADGSGSLQRSGSAVDRELLEQQRDLWAGVASTTHITIDGVGGNANRQDAAATGSLVSLQAQVAISSNRRSGGSLGSRAGTVKRAARTALAPSGSAADLIASRWASDGVVCEAQPDVDDESDDPLVLEGAPDLPHE